LENFYLTWHPEHFIGPCGLPSFFTLILGINKRSSHEKGYKNYGTALCYRFHKWVNCPDLLVNSQCDIYTDSFDYQWESILKTKNV